MGIHVQVNDVQEYRNTEDCSYNDELIEAIENDIAITRAHLSRMADAEAEDDILLM